MSDLIIDDPHRPVNLELEMQGPIFEEGLPLPITIKSLECIQGVVDLSYLALANKTRMSAQERSLFYLRSQGIKRGSLFTEFGLVFSALQPALPIISSLGPTGVWEHAKEAFGFLRLVFKAKKNGGDISIQQSGDGSLINVNTGSQIATFNQCTFHIATNSLPHYEKLAKYLSPEKITDIRLGQGRARDISLSLSLDDQTLFELPTKIESEQHPLDCEIFEFDKYNGTGRVSVFDDQSLPKGEYKFSVLGRQDLREYIEAMLRKHVKITCLEEIVDHPLVGRKIAALQVLNVRNVRS